MPPSCRMWKGVSPSDAPVILCVDDEPVGLSARVRLLSIAGYTVFAATNSDEALRLFGCKHVDLVISDHLLPDFSGAELVRRMKQLKPETPIVLLTGLVDPPLGFERADQVLTKGSMTPPEFLDEIANVLSKAQSGA